METFWKVTLENSDETQEMWESEHSFGECLGNVSLGTFEICTYDPERWVKLAFERFIQVVGIHLTVMGLESETRFTVSNGSSDRMITPIPHW